MALLPTKILYLAFAFLGHNSGIFYFFEKLGLRLANPPYACHSAFFLAFGGLFRLSAPISPLQATAQTIPAEV
jgi:hypothetical protein